MHGSPKMLEFLFAQHFLICWHVWIYTGKVEVFYMWPGFVTKMHQNTIPEVSFPSLDEIQEMSTGGDTGTCVSKCGLERSLYLPDAK